MKGRSIVTTYTVYAVAKLKIIALRMLWDGRGSVVRALAAKARSPEFPARPDFLSYSKLSDVDGMVLSSVVL